MYPGTLHYLRILNKNSNVELSTFKTSLECKEAKNQRRMFAFFLVSRNITTDVLKKVLRKHLIVIFRLFTPGKKS